MDGSRNINRRTVVKAFGAGAIGSSILTSTTTAAPGSTEINLRGHNFTPNSAKVRLGGEGGSATVRWSNEEETFVGEDLPVPHDVHIHHEGEDLVKSGFFTQMNSFDPDGDGPIPPIPLGPTFYEVTFSDVEGDLIIEETGGMVESPPLEDIPPIYVIDDPETTTIEDWGGTVTFDVHCSLHDILLDVNEGEVITRRIQSEETEPPYALHAGFFKMDGGLTIMR